MSAAVAPAFPVCVAGRARTSVPRSSLRGGAFTGRIGVGAAFEEARRRRVASDPLLWRSVQHGLARNWRGQPRGMDPPSTSMRPVAAPRKGQPALGMAFHSSLNRRFSRRRRPAASERCCTRARSRVRLVDDFDHLQEARGRFVADDEPFARRAVARSWARVAARCLGAATRTETVAARARRPRTTSLCSPVLTHNVLAVGGSGSAAERTVVLSARDHLGSRASGEAGPRRALRYRWGIVSLADGVGRAHGRCRTASSRRCRRGKARQARRAGRRTRSAV